MRLRQYADIFLNALKKKVIQNSSRNVVRISERKRGSSLPTETLSTTERQYLCQACDGSCKAFHLILQMK